MKKHLNLLKKLRLACLAMLWCPVTFCQVLSSVQVAFTKNYKNTLQEKIFVHTDKAFYLPGEILWFKIYNVEATVHIPLTLSKVAYAELLDKNSVPVLQAKIMLNDGSGNGSLYLPVNLASGNYKFRAYTSWMKNFSPGSYFEKAITIVNPLSSPEVTASADAAYDVQFFPEGGNLIGGFNTKVAFRVVGQNGKGVSFTGMVIDANNDTVARFKPLKFGIGSFKLSAVTGNVYKAIIKIPDGQSVTKTLPNVTSQGYAMEVNDADAGRLKITVRVNGVGQGTSVYLFMHSGALLAADAAQEAHLINGTAVFNIDKSKLGEGISHITVFNGEKKPVCERLYFKRPVQKLFITAAAEQGNYASRKKVTVNISAKDNAGKPQFADMSMSVYKLDALQTVDPYNIVNYMWLTSDIKGNVESPGYYLENTTAEADEALDNLMLSQGWSRFTWAELLKPAPPVYRFLPEPDGLLVNGKLTNTRTGALADGVLAYMGVVGKHTGLCIARSDSAGNILFNTHGMYGTGEAVFTTNTLKDTTYRMDIESPFSDRFSNIKVPAWQFDKKLANVLLIHSTAMQVHNIYAGNAIKQFYVPKTDTTAFYGKADKVYKLDDYTRFTTMEEVLREYIREVGVGHEQKKFHVSILTYDRGYLESNPLVLYDNVPVFDMDKLMALDPLKVKTLEAVAQHYYYGPVAEDGILNLHSYKDDLAGYDIDPHALVMDYEGVQFKRQFFSPVYQTDDQVNSRKPDFRNLLFWSPDVYTDVKGNKSLSFYTSDESGNYIGVVQGLTPNGQAAVNTFTFEVKK